MSEWYYARGGQQSGPVPFEKIVEMARSGGLDPEKDLVWTGTMKDWTPAGKVEGVFSSAPAVPAPPADPANPYAAPQTTWMAPAPVAGEALQEIVPGSDPFDAVACIKRGWELTLRNISIIVLIGLIYVGIMVALNIVSTVLQGVMTHGSGSAIQSGAAPEPTAAWFIVIGGFSLISQVFSLFISLGICRIGLNLVSGEEANIGMMFGQGRKILRAILATILFSLMVAALPVLFMIVGVSAGAAAGTGSSTSVPLICILLAIITIIFPGFYFILRFGQNMNAIVDKDQGAIQALKYSSSITTGNRLNILVLGILGFLLSIAGMLALCIGILVVMPVIWLASLVAYRWMQYGHKAAMDHPGTTTPLLKSI